jgi:anti-sigma B factor antagonist
VVRPQAEIVDGKTAVVEIDGPLDSITSPGVEDYINSLLGKDIKHVLLDGEKMKYVSSEGIGLLLFLGKKISELDGIFIFFNLTAEIHTLFRLLGFDAKFLITGSRQDAFSLLEREIERPIGGAGATLGAGAAFVEAGSAEIKPASVGEDYVFEGTVVACANCNNPVRVFKDGTYLCPHCNTEITIRNREAAGERNDESGNWREDFGPLIIECAHCGSLIRIKKSGKYRCPDCNSGFTAMPDQSIIF